MTMAIEQAERIYRGLLRADQEQRERSSRDGRTHPDYTPRWSTPEARRAQEVLGEERMQEIRFAFHEARP